MTRGLPRVEEEPVYVTRPTLAPLAEYLALLEEIWERGILTNDGPLVRRLEAALCQRLAIESLVLTTNGTIALQLAIRALELRGDIITTPFSWVATCGAIRWEGCTPVFADIDEESFNLDPRTLEERITPRTSAILPVHVFSAPCDVEAISAVAGHHRLKVLYDAAHANFVQHRGRSIMTYGDMAATSFHATKIFNTGEGGACVTTDGALDGRLRRLRYFGHQEWKGMVSDGCNGKMTEVHAALGLANLPHLDAALARRRAKHGLYMDQLRACAFIRFQRFDPESYNYSYMPVVFETERLRDLAEARLQAHNIHPRRYFWPPLNTSPVLPPGPPMPIAESISARILCLPLYPALGDEQVENVCAVIRSL